MAGQVKRIIDNIIKVKGKGNNIIINGIKTKLILKKKII